MSRIHNITGILLHKRPFMESDLIVSVLDSEGYRRELLVKGAATGNSKRKQHLESLNWIRGTRYESQKHEYLQSVQCQSSWLRVKSNLEAILKLQLLTEIIQKTVLPNDPHPEIYTLLLETLQLNNAPQPYPFASEVALIKLAHFLGFLPNFKECSHCHCPLDEEAHWSAQAGTLHCENCRNESTDQRMPLKYRKALEFFRRAPQQEFQRVQLKEHESKVLSDFIPSLFTSHMDQPLKTLTLMV